ncbi:MAG TPA: outer membrane beta-barrel protein [Methylomirabilota bacterium]|jgi:opacity protein-like surface antigen
MARPSWKCLTAAVVVGGLALAVPLTVRAEPYVAIMGGIAFTESKKTDSRLAVNGTTLLDGTFDEVDFNDSPLIGGKAGYFLNYPVLGGHFGAEVEFYYTEPTASRQTVTFNGTFLGAPATFPLSIQHAYFEVYTVALNALYRYPVFTGPDYPFGRLQPYAGLGLGAFISTMYTRTSPLDHNRYIHDTDVAPGLQVIGGLKAYVVKHVAFFAEYRYVDTADFNFNFEKSGTVGGFPATETARDRSSLTQHQLVFGLAIHF